MKLKLRWSWIGVVFVIAGVLIVNLPNIIEYMIGAGLILIGIFYFVGKST